MSRNQSHLVTYKSETKKAILRKDEVSHLFAAPVSSVGKYVNRPPKYAMVVAKILTSSNIFWDLQTDDKPSSKVEGYWDNQS